MPTESFESGFADKATFSLLPQKKASRFAVFFLELTSTHPTLHFLTGTIFVTNTV